MSDLDRPAPAIVVGLPHTNPGAGSAKRAKRYKNKTVFWDEMGGILFVCSIFGKLGQITVTTTQHWPTFVFDDSIVYIFINILKYLH